MRWLLVLLVVGECAILGGQSNDPFAYIASRHYPTSLSATDVFSPKRIQLSSGGNAQIFGPGGLNINDGFSQTWFFVLPGTNITCPTCNLPTPLVGGEGEEGLIEGSYTALLNDELPPEMPEAIKWKLEADLYEKVSSDSSLQNDPTLGAFLIGVTNTSPALYKEVERDLRAAFTLTLTDQYLLDSLKHELSNCRDSLQHIEGLLENNPDNADALKQAYYQWQNTLVTYEAQFRAVLQGIEPIQQGQLQAVKTENGFLPDMATYEYNTKRTTEIYADLRVSGGVFTEDMKADLIAISEQCAILGGHSVIVARSLRAGFDPLATYDDDLYCLSGGIQPLSSTEHDFESAERFEENKETNVVQFSLVPNPATDALTVFNGGSDLYQTDVTITDLFGRQVASHRIYFEDGLSAMMDVSQLPAGTYVISAFDGSDLIFRDKLLIVK